MNLDLNVEYSFMFLANKITTGRISSSFLRLLLLVQLLLLVSENFPHVPQKQASDTGPVQSAVKKF